MQCLSRTELKTVLYECLVAATTLASQYLLAAIGSIHEEWMTNVLHVSSYLMGTSCLQNALYQGGITEAFPYSIMSHCTLANATVRLEDLHA